MATFKIKQLCKERGITQKELASNIGVSPVGLAKAIGGNTTIGTLEKIAEALDVPVWDLFTRDEETLTCPECGARLKLVKVQQ